MRIFVTKTSSQPLSVTPSTKLVFSSSWCNLIQLLQSSLYEKVTKPKLKQLSCWVDLLEYAFPSLQHFPFQFIHSLSYLLPKVSQSTWATKLILYMSHVLRFVTCNASNNVVLAYLTLHFLKPSLQHFEVHHLKLLIFLTNH